MHASFANGRTHYARALLWRATVGAITGLGFVRATTAGVTGTIDGSITADYSSSTDQSGNTTFNFLNASGNLTINGLPTIPIAANAQLQPEYWSAPTTWNGGEIFVATDAITVYNYIDGIFSSGGVSALTDTSPTVNTLINSGPTEQTIPIPGISWSSDLAPGASASLGVSANLTYDVLIPTGANVLMDQPTVVVQSLIIQQGGSLTGNGGFTVRTDLSNYGTLYNLGGTVGRNAQLTICSDRRGLGLVSSDRLEHCMKGSEHGDQPFSYEV
jgi:hypothetical protein